MAKNFSELELAEALFNTVGFLLEEFNEAGLLSEQEHERLLDSLWFILDYGTRVPK